MTNVRDPCKRVTCIMKLLTSLYICAWVICITMDVTQAATSFISDPYYEATREPMHEVLGLVQETSSGCLDVTDHYNTSASGTAGICVVFQDIGTTFVAGDLFSLQINNRSLRIHQPFQAPHTYLEVHIDNSVCRLREPLKRGVWNHICAGFQHNISQPFWLTLQGQILTVDLHKCKIDPYKSEDRPKVERNLVCLGRRTEEEQSIIGMVSITSLLTEVPDKPPTCILSFDNSFYEWVFKGSVSIIEVNSYGLCSEPGYHDINIDMTLNHEDCTHECKSLGGRLPWESEVRAGEIKYNFSSCSADKSPMSWMFLHYLNYVTLGDLKACPVFHGDGDFGWQPCLSKQSCGLCRVPGNQTYTLFGPVGFFDRKYTLKVASCGAYYLQGELKSKITFAEEKGWYMHSVLHNDYWIYPGESLFPMGRHTWYSDLHNTTLTVSHCNILQFTSNDGRCIPLAELCGGWTGTDDGRDKMNCQQKSVQNPFNVGNKLFKGKALWFKASVHNIENIDIAKQLANLELKIGFKFQNERKHFGIIREHEYPCDDFYFQHLLLTAGYRRGENVPIKQHDVRCFDHADFHEFEYGDLNDPSIISVSSIRTIFTLTVDGTVHFSLPCKFKLYLYPFGKYQCNVSFTLKNMENNNNYWIPWDDNDDKYFSLAYQGDHDLNDLELTNITLEIQRYYVTLTLHLAGRYEYHLLNSFLPSGLMFVVSYSTFYFPVDRFSERITMPTMSLLVLASQQTYIKTPYFKLLDVWYIAIIVLCFMINMSNFVINILLVKNSAGLPTQTELELLDKALPEQPTRKSKGCLNFMGRLKKNTSKSYNLETKRTNTKAERWNIICRCMVMTAFIVYVTLFALIAAEIL